MRGAMFAGGYGRAGAITSITTAPMYQYLQRVIAVRRGDQALLARHADGAA